MKLALSILILLSAGNIHAGKEVGNGRAGGGKAAAQEQPKQQTQQSGQQKQTQQQQQQQTQAQIQGSPSRARICFSSASRRCDQSILLTHIEVNSVVYDGELLDQWNSREILDEEGEIRFCSDGICLMTSHKKQILRAYLYFALKAGLSVSIKAEVQRDLQQSVQQ